MCIPLPLPSLHHLAAQTKGWEKRWAVDWLSSQRIIYPSHLLLQFSSEDPPNLRPPRRTQSDGKRNVPANRFRRRFSNVRRCTSTSTLPCPSFAHSPSPSFLHLFFIFHFPFHPFRPFAYVNPRPPSNSDDSYTNCLFIPLQLLNKYST